MERIHEALAEKTDIQVREIVEAMKLKPKSGIGDEDAKKILEAFRDFYRSADPDSAKQ
jgi:hypothetical protein